MYQQIIGEIEDRARFREAEDNIVQDQAGHYRVKALTDIRDFTPFPARTFSDDDSILRWRGSSSVASALAQARRAGSDSMACSFGLLRADSAGCIILEVEKKKSRSRPTGTNDAGT